MKNLTTAFRTGDLRPKERVMLQIHNEVAKDKGKEILTEADKYALGEGWRAKTNEEAREYNRYIEGWRLLNAADIDSQTTYLGATNALLRAGRLIDMVVLKDDKGTLEFYKKFMREHSKNEAALELVLQNSGLELEYVVYRYAFESLSEDLKKDILALNPDGETETQYFDQEEAIADLFNGKNTLTKEAKEKLADLIVASLYNEHAAFFTKLEAKSDLRGEYFFSGYYGELPALEILNKWAFYNNQLPKKAEDLLQHIPEEKEYTNEDEEVADLFDAIRKELIPKLDDYAKKHQTSVGELMKQTLLRWLNEGLFVDEYAPICNSNLKQTCNDADTKLPHKEVFKAWLKAKGKAKQTIQGLIDTGELKVEDRVEEIRRFTKREEGGLEKDKISFKRTLKVLTGQSLYALTGGYTFAEDFKKQADDLEGLGGLILFLRGRSFLHQYATLLGFPDLFKRLSKIFEIDLTYSIQSWVATFAGDVEMLNGETLMIGERMKLASYMKHNVVFLIEFFVEDMLIDLEKVKPSRDRVERYFKDCETALGDEFKLHE